MNKDTVNTNQRLKAGGSFWSEQRGVQGFEFYTCSFQNNIEVEVVF